MSLTQAGPTIDKELNELSRELTAAEKLIVKGTIAKDKTWTKVKSFLTEFPKLRNRFIAHDGNVLHLQSRAGKVRLNEERLKNLIFERYKPRRAAQIWNAITIPQRVVSAELIEVASRRNLLPTSLVSECIEEGLPTEARTHPGWSKDDVEKAAIYDIQMFPMTNEELISRMVAILTAEEETEEVEV